MASSSAVVTADVLVYDDNIQLYRQYASASWFPVSLALHLAALACLDEYEREQIRRESLGIMSYDIRTRDLVKPPNARGGQIQPSLDFQLFPSPSLGTPLESSHYANWVERQYSNTQPTEQQKDPADTDSWMTVTANSPLINGRNSPVPITENFVPGASAGGEKLTVKKNRKGEEPEPVQALSYPTPMSNPSNTPHFANNALEQSYKLRPKLAHAVPNLSTISRPTNLAETSTEQEIHNKSGLRLFTDNHDGIFQGDSAMLVPNVEVPLITKPSDNLVIEGTEELPQQEGIVIAQNSPAGQYSDGFPTRAAESYCVPPSESRMLATIHSAYNTGTGKALTQLEMEQVIKVGNRALDSDHFSELFNENSDSWLLNEPQGRHVLGIPIPDFESNKASCVAYVKALEFGFGPKRKDNALLYLLSRRVMQIWQDLFFREYVKDLEREEAAGSNIERNGRQLKTVARDSILADVYGSEYRQQQQYRTKHIEHCRWGHRWWRIASCNGMGVVLLASKEFAEEIGNTKFREAMVDALIIYLLNAYPQVVSLFRSFGSITESIMVGKGFSCFKDVEIIDLFNQLTRSDLHIQVFPRNLLSINPESVSRSAASNFIFSQKKYYRDLEAAGSLGPTFLG